MKQEGIHHFSTAGDTKASIVERFNRTLKERMYRYFTSKNTLSYLPILQSLVKGYNGTYHRSIGMPPEKVRVSNEGEVWNRLYAKRLSGKKPNRGSVMKVGDRVRLNKKFRTFEKEGCPIHPICNGSSKWLTVRHGSFNPSMQHDDPSTGSHFARDLEKIHYIVMREGRNVVGPTGSSRSVSDGDDPSTGSHFARDLEKIHYIVMKEGRNVVGLTGSSQSVSDGDDPSTGSHFARDLEIIHYSVLREGRNVVGPTGSSRSVTDGDDPSTGSHFARDLEKILYRAYGPRDVYGLIPPFSVFVSYSK